MELIINEDNLQINEIQEFCIKARAILIDENNKILIANYANVILLPGGKVNEKELISHAIIREIKEELGQDYNNDELEYFLTLNYYQKNYPKKEGIFQNRLVKTYYFLGRYKKVTKELQKLTEKEKKGNFKLELVSLEEIENIILNNKNNNPRNIYFQKELMMIILHYKKLHSIKIKRLKLN